MAPTWLEALECRMDPRPELSLAESAFLLVYTRLRNDARRKLSFAHRSVPVDSLCQRLANHADISLEAARQVWEEDIRERRMFVWETAGNLDPDYIRTHQPEQPARPSDRDYECRVAIERAKYPPIDYSAVLQNMAHESPFARLLLRSQC